MIYSKEIGDDLTIELSPRQSKHCIAVLEVKIGSKLNVGVKNSGKGTATVIGIKKIFQKDKNKNLNNNLSFDDHSESISEECQSLINNFTLKNIPVKTRKTISEINNFKNSEYSVVIKLDSEFHKLPCTNEYPLIDLIIALPRPKVFEKILEYAVTIGVGRIIFVCTEKSEKSYLNSSKMKRESINQIVQNGLEQACSTLWPDIYIYASWKLFLQHLKNFFFKREDMIGIVADMTGRKIFEVGLQKHFGSVILAIGPEGGWAEQEIKDLVNEGFYVVSIGNRILKVETAVISLYSKIELLLTDEEIRNNIKAAKREKYWLSNNGPGVIVLPVRGRKWENKYLYTHSTEIE